MLGSSRLWGRTGTCQRARLPLAFWPVNIRQSYPFATFQQRLRFTTEPGRSRPSAKLPSSSCRHSALAVVGLSLSASVGAEQAADANRARAAMIALAILDRDIDDCKRASHRWRRPGQSRVLESPCVARGTTVLGGSPGQTRGHPADENRPSYATKGIPRPATGIDRIALAGWHRLIPTARVRKSRDVPLVGWL